MDVDEIDDGNEHVRNVYDDEGDEDAHDGNDDAYRNGDGHAYERDGEYHNSVM